MAGIHLICLVNVLLHILVKPRVSGSKCLGANLCTCHETDNLSLHHESQALND